MFSACSSGPYIEITVARVTGGSSNIAGGAVNAPPGGELYFMARPVLNGATIHSAQTYISWELVANSDSAQRNGASPATSLVAGTEVSSSNGTGATVNFSPNQPDGLLRLNVTTTHEGNLMSAYVIINVSAKPLVVPNEAHELFQDPETSTWWRVLVPNDGNGNALIVTEYVHVLNTRYHSTTGFTLFQLAEVNDNLRRWWNNEWTGNGITASPSENAIGPTLRARALNYEFQNESGDSIPRMNPNTGAGIEVDRIYGTGNSLAGSVHWDTDVLRGHTRPVPNSNSVAEPFILSVSEVNHYFSGQRFAPGPMGRRAQKFNAMSTDANWWLRSPGDSTDASSTGRHSIINNRGDFSTSNATGAWEYGGLRPALWIRR